VQVSQQFLGVGVGVLGGHGVAGGFATCQVGERGCQAGVHAGQRAAVGLVHAVGIGVGRALGQCSHLG
jgi:hypothetical protein